MYNPSAISFGRETTGTLSTSTDKEWLITNGIGGFASGTISSLLTRRYHGLLIAALSPPLGRTYLATQFNEVILYDHKEYPLHANRWEKDSVNPPVNPDGYHHIESFHLDGSIPTWIYACGDALVEKKIWMEQGSNTTYVRYSLIRSSSLVKLSLDAVVNHRSFHSITHAGDWKMNIELIPNGLKITLDSTPSFYVLSDAMRPTVKNEWYKNYYLSEEKARGFECVEDHLCAGSFEASLSQGESITLMITMSKPSPLNGNEALERRMNYEKQILSRVTDAPFWVRQLHLAADQFIVDRLTKETPSGKSIIAGYPWFGDWGRDTMISLPGLTLSTGRFLDAKTILQTFGKYLNQGMLPNQLPEEAKTPEYNTVDASLWYIEAIRAYYSATQDQVLLKELFPALLEIIQWYQKGTRYQIHVDPQDGLLYAGEEGIQLTWMDAKVDNRVITPRTGKAVEINALWYQALCTMTSFAKILKQSETPFQTAAEKVRSSFNKFWNNELGYCFDVLDSPQGNDSSFRPNQIFAVSLQNSPLSSDQKSKIVDLCGRKLLTSHGLRSLDPNDPRYRGSYSGNPSERDRVYHQGTVWGWLLGPYALAHYQVHQDASAALQILEPMALHLLAAGLGTCSEIFDGDAPMTPKGCIAQAWSVAELLRAYHLIKQPKH